MAGYVTVNTPNGVKDREFHMGQNIRFLFDEIEDVIEIQLDGDELDHFFDNFQNFPQTRKKVQTWFGDFARFIVQNW